MWTVLISLCVLIIALYLGGSDIFLILGHCMGGSSSHTMAAPVVIQSTAKHTATVIFLHGLGDTGHGWSDVFKMIRQPHIKYLCPTAPAIPVTLNGGMRMPSWFDIKGLEPGSAEDEPGIKLASKALQELISSEEAQGISRSRIIVGGFSQGGAVALYSALAEAKPSVAGLVALSTWLPLHESVLKGVKSNQATPMFQAHGEADPMVRKAIGDLTAQVLKSINPQREYKTYPGLAHSSCDEEIRDMKVFIDRCLPPV